MVLAVSVESSLPQAASDRAINDTPPARAILAFFFPALTICLLIFAYWKRPFHQEMHLSKSYSCFLLHTNFTGRTDALIFATLKERGLHYLSR